jgi:antitoxin CptB
MTTLTPDSGPDDVRLKRLRIRSWRRGTKEMDLILGAFCDEQLAGLSEEEVSLYEALLSENDHDLYGWVTGRGEPPARFAALIARIAAHARGSAA